MTLKTRIREDGSPALFGPLLHLRNTPRTLTDRQLLQLGKGVAEVFPNAPASKQQRQHCGKGQERAYSRSGCSTANPSPHSQGHHRQARFSSDSASARHATPLNSLGHEGEFTALPDSPQSRFVCLYSILKSSVKR